ncbi:hypothetical protein ABEX38_29975 [Priestia megaterium]
MLVQSLINGNDPTSIHHDLRDQVGQRIEVKFSRVEKKHGVKLTESNVLDVIENEGLSVRLFPFPEWRQHEFDCNIQQVKPHEFDHMFYGLLFADRIMIFLIDSYDITEDKKLNYSNKQHKGNIGEGQFHVKTSNLMYHMSKYHLMSLSYSDALKILGGVAA